MNLPIRLGVRGDVVLPMQPGEHYDHVIEVVDAPVGGIGPQADADICPTSSCRAPDAGPNRATGWRALLMTRQGTETCLEALDVSTCPHLTQIVVSDRQSLPSWPEGVPAISLWDLAALAHSSRPDMHGSDFPRSLRNALLINLDSSLKTGLLNTNTDEPGTDVYGDAIYRLACQRRALTDVHAFSLAAQVDGRSLAVVSGALARADAELQIVIAEQMYRLFVSNTKLGESARQTESRIAERERKWSRLGAATVIPLLFLSLLGTNTLPKRLFGLPTDGSWTFLVVTLMTAGLAALGFTWANYNRKADRSI